ncbi:MAG: hypothetical protein WA118_13910 [Carboxydocellales bacterium]
MVLKSISRFLDKFDLPWVLLALITILIIVSTNSRKDFWRCFPVGIWTMVTGALLEQFFIKNKFWVEHFKMIKVGELDLFVIIGPFFAIGFLLIRFLPENRLAKFLAVLAWSGLATGIEFMAGKLGFLEYDSQKWSALHSLGIYYLSLMSALGFYCIYNNHSNQHSDHR